MKKTLFIAAIAAVCAGAHAAAADAPAIYQTPGPGTFVATDIVVTPDNQNSYINGYNTFEGGTATGGVSIGMCAGEGSLTVTGGASVTTPNNLYIGGNGYWGSATKPAWYTSAAHDGTVTIEKDSSITIGGASGNSYSAGAQLNVGTSSTASTGTLIADGGSIYANVLTSIGGGNSEGYLILKNGADFSVGPRRTTSSSQVFFQTGVDAGSSGHILIDNSSLTVPTEGYTGKSYTYIGFSGDADVTISNGGSMSVGGEMMLLGVYGTSTSTITVGERCELNVDCDTYVGYQGEGHLTIEEGGVANTKTIYVGGDSIKDCSLINRGDMQVDGNIELYNNSTLYTGTVTITNRGTQTDDGSGTEVGCDYDTHITFANEGQGIVVGSKVVVGALLVGGDGTQFLKEEDYAAIDAAVLAGLGVSGAQVVNRIGENIEAQYTTDTVNDQAGSKVVAVANGSAVINEGAVAHDGTIGSYALDINETNAHLRMDETVTGGTAVWKGGDLRTLAGETTTIAGASQVKVTKEGSELVVVENSKMSNEGAITGDVKVEGTVDAEGNLVKQGVLDNQGTIVGNVTVEGTMKGTGTVKGDVAVSQGAHLVVGNSPGAMTIDNVDLDGALDFSLDDVAAAATDTVNGWGSGTYSQLVLGEGAGAIAFGDNSVINIILGGNMFQNGVMSKNVELDLDLITGITSLTCTGTGDVLDILKGKTTFSVANPQLEPGSITADPGYVGFNINDLDWHYELVDAGNGTQTLKLKGTMTVPEPATATLSLLALAALAARRRRKNA